MLRCEKGENKRQAVLRSGKVSSSAIVLSVGSSAGGGKMSDSGKLSLLHA
jgi:hypothetical protein